MANINLIAMIVLSVFVFSTSSYASVETINCTTRTKASVRNLTAVRHHYGYEPQWLDAEMQTGFFHKKQKLSLTPLYLAGNYVLKDTWGSLAKASLILDLGKFKGPGKYDRVEAVRFKGEPNEEHFEMRCVVAGDTPYISYCNSEVVKNLLSASTDRSPDILDMILSCKPDVNVKNDKGCTPIVLVSDRDCGTGRFDLFNHFASANRALESLIAAGASVNDTDPATRETALAKFVRYQDDPVVKFLLSKNANVNAQDSDGYSATMRAAETRYVKMVKLLLKYKPDLALKNENGQTAYDIAKANDDKQIMELLEIGDVKELVIQGKSDGTCVPDMIHLSQGTKAKLVLKAESKMILFEAKDLSLELMAGSNGIDTKNYIFDKKGTFPFTCGEHGGSNPTHGSIMVM